MAEHSDLRTEPPDRTNMLSSYLTIALRALRRHPIYACINIAGLSVAIAAATIITLYIRHELSYDLFHQNIDRIYEVGERSAAVSESTSLLTRAKLLPALLENYPAVESGSRIQGLGATIRHEQAYYEEQGLYVDSTFFNVFTVPLAAGDPQAALAQKDAIVISQPLASRIFGGENPVGRVLKLNYRRDYTVTGVMAAFPSNSTLQGDFVIRYTNFEEAMGDALDWSNTNAPTYLLLRKGSDIAAVEKQITQLLAQRDSPERQAVAQLFPFRAHHLGTEGLSVGGAGKKTTLSVLAGLALIILLIAAINFANLTTARSLSRTREIGVRKLVGAVRGQLAFQFLGEALLMSSIASAFGVAIAWLMSPLFKDLLGVSLRFNTAPGAWLILGAIGLGVGLVAGSYPAFYLSSFQPADTLKGRIQGGRRGGRVGSALVIAQFSLSIALICGTLVVWQQISYMKTQDLHFDTDGTLAVPISPHAFEDSGTAASRIEALKTELGRHHRIPHLSSSMSVPGRYTQWGASFTPEDRNDAVHMSWTSVDADYFRVYGIDLLEGRFFSDSLATDVWSTAVINETALLAFGWDTAVGKRIHMGSREVKVIGVAADFHYESLEKSIAPVVHIYAGPGVGSYRFLSAKITPGPLPPVRDFIEAQLSELEPGRTFDYFFVDDEFSRLYEAVERRGRLVGTFALLAIMIACLGLLGLASHAAVARTKEIGIRKTVGASVIQVVALLSNDFLKLVGISMVIGGPLAYLAMSRWLDGFAYRIDLGWELFLTAGVAALLLALITVSYHAVKAALTDPVKSLRYE